MSSELATTGATFLQHVNELDAGLAFFERMGRVGLYPDGIKSPQDALMVAAAGRRFGFGPLESLQKFHVVKGKVSPSSDLRAGILMRSPLCLYLRCVVEAERCTYTTARADDPDHEVAVTYTKQDASTAGLWGSGTWKKHPKAMLRARCVSIISRQVYPDLFAGLYDADEIENFNTPAPRPRPQRAPQEHPAIEPDIIEGELIPDEPTPEPKPKKPTLSPYGFSVACEEMGIDRALLEAAGAERGGEWNDFRRGGTIEKMRKLGRYEYARSIEPSGAAAWALFDALTGGQAGVEADAAGMSGVEAHEQMRGDWLTKHIEAQS